MIDAIIAYYHSATFLDHLIMVVGFIIFAFIDYQIVKWINRRAARKAAAKLFINRKPTVIY